jgi:SAM-dependent methyltransferase
MGKIEEKEEIEINFWKDSASESPAVFTIGNLFNKMGEAPIFYNKVKRYHRYFEKAPSILELGAGQGWASCIVKYLYPGATLHASDISPFAIESIKYWEDIFKVKVDNTFACRSYQIPLPDSSVDLVFCFAAAHHFVKHRSSLKEINRVLRPGGVCLYLYEPTCKKYIYKQAYSRVNKKRPEVPEDVLIQQKIMELGAEQNFECELIFAPSLENRGAIETIYYFALSKAKLLREMLPCTADFIFRKEG